MQTQRMKDSITLDKAYELDVNCKITEPKETSLSCHSNQELSSRELVSKDAVMDHTLFEFIVQESMMKTVNA